MINHEAQRSMQWAEIVSAIAIVVSLIYVGIQLTDNTSATRSDTASHASAEFASWYALVATDEELDVLD